MQVSHFINVLAVFLGFSTASTFKLRGRALYARSRAKHKLERLVGRITLKPQHCLMVSILSSLHRNTVLHVVNSHTLRSTSYQAFLWMVSKSP